MSAIAPPPVDAESWVAVLVVVARQLHAAGFHEAAAHIYEAIGTFAD